MIKLSFNEKGETQWEMSPQTYEALKSAMQERLDRALDEACIKGGIQLTPEEAERMEHGMRCNCSHCGYGQNRFG